MFTKKDAVEIRHPSIVYEEEKHEMMPLTEEQKRLAELNHDLVFKFLNENGLPEAQYYDVVIFGYLCAAQEYTDNTKLQKYSFSTVAWKRMQRELFNHIKYLERKKRDIPTISLSEMKWNIEDSICVEDVIAIENKLLEELELNLLLHSLASQITQKQMRIIRMRLDGYRMHDIAREERMTFSDINHQLDGVRDIIIKLIKC